MSERLPEASNPFSGHVVWTLLLVGLLSFAAVVALMAWSPELASRDRPGGTPYSRSATGFAGLIDMLEAEGRQASVSRLGQTMEAQDGRLMIVTLPLHGRDLDLDTLAEPALIILPKWTIIPNPARKAFEIDTNLADISTVDASLGLVAENASVHRLRNPGKMATPVGKAAPDFEHEMQVITSDTLEEVIGIPGGQLLSRLGDRDIYLLSDPDLLNNFGLARLENARLGLGIIDLVSRDTDRPIIFDATLHGFERSNNLLKAMLDIPFLGATLVALAAMILIGWSAAIRFGAPEREAPAFAPGKQALADNSAGLIAMARREPRMAPGYLSLTRRALSRELGMPKTLSESELAALLDRMGHQAGLDESWSKLGAGLTGPAASRDDLRHKARALWRWRKEMTHGH